MLGTLNKIIFINTPHRYIRNHCISNTFAVKGQEKSSTNCNRAIMITGRWFIGVYKTRPDSVTTACSQG